MPEIPAGAKTPQDHKKSAAELEAEGAQTITLTWRDWEFTVPASIEDSTADTLEAFEDGKAVRAVKGILGAEQYAKFRAKFKPTVRDLQSIMEIIAPAMGLSDSGE